MQIYSEQVSEWLYHLSDLIAWSIALLCRLHSVKQTQSGVIEPTIELVRALFASQLKLEGKKDKNEEEVLLFMTDETWYTLDGTPFEQEWMKIRYNTNPWHDRTIVGDM